MGTAAQGHGNDRPAPPPRPIAMASESRKPGKDTPTPPAPPAQPTFRDLTKLVHPFPQSVIHKNPSGGGQYVKHSTVEQRLLDVLGPHTYEIVREIRGSVAGKPGNPQGSSQRAKEGTPDLVDAVVGCVSRMTVTVDGKTVTVTEVGDCESPHNWPHDGARLKDASSDAYKRCAMRLGVGLHLWSQDDFYIAQKLMDQDTAAHKDAK